MTIAAVRKNKITNGEFKEIHYTVTAPGTPGNMGGFGVHITLVRHGDTKTQRDRVHIYFRMANGALQIIPGLGQTHPITDGGLFQDFRKAACDFFVETCANKGWPLPGTVAPVATAQSYESAFPSLKPAAKAPPQAVTAPLPQAVIPSPPQAHVQTVGLPVNTNVAPVIVALPIAQANMHFDVVQSVLDASGAFDEEYDVVGSVLAHCGAFD